MAFNLRTFVKEGLGRAVGKMADYQIILNAVGWFEKGVLTEDDLADIENLLFISDEENTDTEPIE